MIWKTLSYIKPYSNFQVQRRKVVAKARMACPPIWGSLEQPPTIILTKCFRQPLKCLRVWTQQLVVSQSPEKPPEPPACQLLTRPKMVSPQFFLQFLQLLLCFCNYPRHLASKFWTILILPLPILSHTARAHNNQTSSSTPYCDDMIFYDKKSCLSLFPFFFWWWFYNFILREAEMYFVAEYHRIQQPILKLLILIFLTNCNISGNSCRDNHSFLKLRMRQVTIRRNMIWTWESFASRQ